MSNMEKREGFDVSTAKNKFECTPVSGPKASDPDGWMIKILSLKGPSNSKITMDIPITMERMKIFEIVESLDKVL